jgi:ketosteroid isomerase-like protein
MSELETYYADLIGAVGRQDLAGIQGLIDPSFVIHYDSGLPFGGVYRGVEGFFGVLGQLTGRLEDLKTEQLNYMEDANGEQYALIIRLTARVAATGQRIETQVSELWTVRDGKAVEARVWYWGAAAIEWGIGPA